MKAATLRKKEQAKRLKQLHILDCAENLMRQKGIPNWSMDGLAKAAKMAKGTLYLYFKDKEDVLAHLSTKAREDLLKRFNEEVSQCDHSLDQIRAIMWANYHFQQENRLYNDLVSFYEVNRHLEEPDALRLAGYNIHSFVVSVMEKARKNGEVKADLDIAAFSMTLWGMCVGMVQLIDTKAELVDAYTNKTKDGFYGNFIELIISGVKA
ncbi:MAG: TetR/AcrR family transcriptional regulator [Bacteroidota bacterium]